MGKLFLNVAEKEVLKQLLAHMEVKYGADYRFEAGEVEFNCPCSGHATSCIYH